MYLSSWLSYLQKVPCSYPCGTKTYFMWLESIRHSFQTREWLHHWSLLCFLAASLRQTMAENACTCATFSIDFRMCNTSGEVSQNFLTTTTYVSMIIHDINVVLWLNKASRWWMVAAENITVPQAYVDWTVGVGTLIGLLLSFLIALGKNIFHFAWAHHLQYNRHCVTGAVQTCDMQWNTCWKTERFVK